MVRTTLLILAVGLNLNCSTMGATEDGEDVDLRIRVENVQVDDSVPADIVQREVRIHLPPGSGGVNAQVLLAFHGAAGTGISFQAGAGLDELADEKGIVVVYPTSQVSNWAEGCDCNNADRLGIDDVGFTEAILDTLSALYQVDTSRTYAVGFSQGGLFAYRLACELPHRFRGIAAVAAPMSVPLSAVCAPEEAVSILTIHGTDDQVLPYEGTSNGALSLLSASGTIDFWRDALRCDARPTRSSERYSSSLSAVIDRFSGCLAGHRLTHFGIEGGAHGWYTDGPSFAAILFREFY